MENKINIAELLKDCPKGMELDCTIYDNLYFYEVDTIGDIKCYIKSENGCLTRVTFYENGCYSTISNAKCVIFPKGKTTWEGFVPPCKFKAGDVLYVDCADKESDGDLYKYIFILKEIDSLGNYFSYCYLSIDKVSFRSNFLTDNRYTARFATEEEKQKLFQAIKDNGYEWNEETKTLEKLIEPKKFDIATLKPFESRVLVRDTDTDVWIGGFYSHHESKKFYIISRSYYYQCIPYEGNEHLLGKTDDCDDFYKTW